MKEAKIILSKSRKTITEMFSNNLSFNNVHELIEKSGDSFVEKYNYLKGNLTLTLSTEHLQTIEIKVKTDFLAFNNFYFANANPIYRVCRIEVEELTSVINVKNNIFMPSDVFGKLMKEVKSNYNLAFGKKPTDFKYIFSLVGYDRLVSCLISNLNDITFQEINENMS